MATKIARRPTSWMPFLPAVSREVEELQDRMRKLFGEPFGMEGLAQPLGWYPPVEVTEAKEEYVVTAELPGIAPETVEVMFENGVLTIAGEKVEEKVEETEAKKLHWFERTYGAFKRAFTFPNAVDETKIRAEFANGLLRIFLPKMEPPKTQGRRIEIGAPK